MDTLVASYAGRCSFCTVGVELKVTGTPTQEPWALVHRPGVRIACCPHCGRSTVRLTLVVHK